MHRVLKPGGIALIMDLNRKASMKATKKVAENMGLKGVMAYIAGAIQRSGFYSRNEFETFISQTEFKEFTIKDTNIGFSIYLRKELWDSFVNFVLMKMKINMHRNHVFRMPVEM